ncbi:MAG: tRNA (adenosine(37)-N6)-threonylcarbamoyltransferase complex dimerization subunit type 1 TsaB [Alloprevotella sp.]|nr:tRNA (adenosine(37)-N6)-threonylcarbamoyltransferase complex dimerization subunit type 1 TsaB [Alloprevotella sp.]
MACILHIETSTDICSVALSQDGALLYEDESREGHRHAEVLAPFVRDAVSFADSHAIPLDAVAVSSGPGSYTGLRIGVSEAKGVCYGRSLPLISVPTLQLICVPALLGEEVEEGTLLCPMIDARRMEVYAAVYDRALREVRPAQADIVDEGTYRKLLDEQPVLFLGNGAAKCHDIIRHPNARFADGAVPRARNMFPLAERRFLQGTVEDTAYFEPFYLKAYQAGAPRNPLENLSRTENEYTK